MSVVDIRGDLAHSPQNDPTPAFWPKSSTTVHWPGTKDAPDTDAVARRYLASVARFHVAKDWNPQRPGVQGGSGIHYHEAVARSGTVFLLRDPDAVLWHAGHAQANQLSRAILVLCSAEARPTSAQLHSLASRIAHHGGPVWPHMHWNTSTECPGPDLLGYLAGGKDMDRDKYKRELEGLVQETVDARVRELLEHDQVTKDKVGGIIQQQLAEALSK